MNKTWTFVVGSVVGLIVGGVLTFYLFVGVPQAVNKPTGAPIQPPDATGTPPATAQIILKQDFFNEVLKTIFRDMNAPSFPLTLTENREANNSAQPEYAAFQGGCDGRITLLPEGSGVQSALKFENGRIVAPLAFKGSYSSMFGCINFSGWTQANLELRFDAAQQNVVGQLNIETVNLDGGAGILGGIVTPLVQKTLNDRVNPIQILQGRQIALNLPIAATNGNMQAQVKDVRAEIKESNLNLFVIYEFSGTKTATNASPNAF